LVLAPMRPLDSTKRRGGILKTGLADRNTRRATVKYVLTQPPRDLGRFEFERDALRSKDEAVNLLVGVCF